MSEIWTLVAVMGAGTIALKAVGPVLLGGRELPPRVAGAMELLSPALLAALVATQGLTAGKSLVIDERAIGLSAAAACVWARLPILAAVVAAAVCTAVARAV